MNNRGFRNITDSGDSEEGLQKQDLSVFEHQRMIEGRKREKYDCSNLIISPELLEDAVSFFKTSKSMR